MGFCYFPVTICEVIVGLIIIYLTCVAGRNNHIHGKLLFKSDSECPTKAVKALGGDKVSGHQDPTTIPKYIIELALR